MPWGFLSYFEQIKTMYQIFSPHHTILKHTNYILAFKIQADAFSTTGYGGIKLKHEAFSQTLSSLKLTCISFSALTLYSITGGLSHFILLLLSQLTSRQQNNCACLCMCHAKFILNFQNIHTIATGIDMTKC